MTISNISTVINEDDFPFVKIKLCKVMNDDEYNFIINKWLELYENKKNFILIFNSLESESISIKYIYRLVGFARKLKKLPKEEQYLKYSIVITNRTLVTTLLNIYKKLIKPISKIYVIKNIEELEPIRNKILN